MTQSAWFVSIQSLSRPECEKSTFQLFCLPYMVQRAWAKNWKSALYDVTKHSQFHVDKQAGLSELNSKHVPEAKTL